MKLVTIKLRGLGTTPETAWLELSPKANLLHFSSPAAGSNFLAALQTINPPYDCSAVEPFADFPSTTEVNGHTRVIQAHKRTIALAVFNSTPDLVEDLVELSPLFYETDRIEVGRRLDYSRWVNFVELASSTRWSEVSDTIDQLAGDTPHANEYSDEIDSLRRDLASTDRIAGKSLRLLERWLTALLRDEPEVRQTAATLLETVKRADYFSKARTIVKSRLPLLHRVGFTPRPGTDDIVPFLLDTLSDQLRENGDPEQLVTLNRRLDELLPQWNLRVIRRGDTCTISRRTGADDCGSPLPGPTGTSMLEHSLLVIALSTACRQEPPIMLVDLNNGPASSLSAADRDRLLLQLVEHCQIILVHSGDHHFNGRLPAKKRRVQPAD